MSSSTADAENDPFYGAGDEISRIFNQVYIGVL
jgi:hypothetical protein